MSLEHFLFAQAKERQRQTHHWHQMILFRNPRSVHQVRTLGRQSSIANPKLLEFAYRDATGKRPHTYLVIDLRNDTIEEMRLVTNVLHENSEPVFVYL